MISSSVRADDNVRPVLTLGQATPEFAAAACRRCGKRVADMKRAVVSGALICFVVFHAAADTVHWTNIDKRPRALAQMKADYAKCEKRFGVPLDGYETSAEFKQCMYQKRWAYAGEDRDWDEIDGSKICHHGTFWGMPSVDCKDIR
jgi:hypothetical protein